MSKISGILTKRRVHNPNSFCATTTQAETLPPPMTMRQTLQALMELASTDFNAAIAGMTNNNATAEDVSNSRDSSPAPLEDAHKAVKKGQVTEELLDSNLSLTADSVRDFFLPRNKAFAREIVAAIARKLSSTPPVMNCEGAGYGFDKDGNMQWDSRIGYPAYEAFETNQSGYIQSLARSDLQRRGFVVHGLRLFQENQKCRNCAVKCRCQNHSIRVSWNLGYKDDSGGDEYDYDDSY